jgi:hypothetical protein
MVEPARKLAPCFTIGGESIQRSRPAVNFSYAPHACRQDFDAWDWKQI